ncbi:putative ribonuclease H-like domain-containing protein [Tanacetum coccineum]
MLVHEQLSQGEGPTSPVGTQHTPTVIETSPQLQNISITYRTTRTRSRRMGIRIPQSNVLPHVADEAITKEMHDGLGRATTTASSLEAEQGSGNISKTQTKATPSRLSSPRTSSEGGPGEGNTSRSGEGSMQLLELIEICTKLSDKVTALEDELRSTKAVYNKSLITLTKRVKKLENKLKLKRRSTIVNSLEDEEASLDIEDPSKQGRMIEEIDQDENVNLVKSSKQGEAHEIAEHGMESDMDFSITRHDEELAQKLHAEELAKSTARQEQENQAHDIDWSDPAVIRYHTLQNRSFSVAEVRKNMCMYLKNQGGYKLSHFKGMKYEEIRPIFERVWDQNQAFVPKDSEIEKEVMKRSGFIQKQSTKEEKEKKKDEESSKQVEEETVQKEDVIPEQVVKESSRKAEGRLKRKASKPREDKDKRQKKQDDPEKLMEYVEVISDSEEVISVTPLAVKSPIVGWKSYCKEDVGYYEIHKADGSYKTYIFFSQMLNDFDREDLIVLYRLFNEKYACTRPGFDDLILWGDIKVMFEPNSDDVVWKNHNSQELIKWKLYDSCGVHSLVLGEVSIHMLVEKKYPLPQDTLTRMLRWKLHVNYNVTYHNLWDIIVNGDLEDEATPSGEQFSPPVSKTGKQLAARRNQKMIKSILLLAIPDEYLLKFHNIPDAKSLWAAIKSRFGVLPVEILRKRHFARECRSGRTQGRRPYGENGRSNAQISESSSQALVAQDGLGGYDWSNDFEVRPVNYALMAISSSNSSSSSDSEHNIAKLEIRGYEIALDLLESRIIGHEKNELAWGEKYEFQNYDLKCREIKINNLNLELEKVVKERDELKDKIAKWEESSKNLDEILNSQMSARDKTGLGYSTQLNELSSNHETDSENSFSVFDGRSSDEESTLANDRSSKADRYKVVPPPIIGNFLTPRADISFGKLVPNPKINRDSVIIEDWNSDDKEEGYEMQTVRLETQTVKTRDDKSGQTSKKQGIGFKKPSISTARPVCAARPSLSTARPVYASRLIYPRMDNVRPRGSCSPIKRAVVNTGKGKLDTDLKRSRWVWRPKGNYLDHVSKDSGSFMLKKGNPEILLQDHTVVDSGCSSHMTGNKAYLSDYEDFNEGFVAFGSDPKGGLSGKDKGPTQEYILLLLQPHKTRIPLNDVVQIAQEKLLKSSPDKDIQILKMFFEKEGQHHMPEDEQHLKKKRGKLHLKKKADQATNTNTLSTDRPFVSTDRPFVSTDRSNTPYVSTASTPTGAQCWSNQSVSILEAKYLNDASTLPNADLPIDPNMPDLEDASDTLPNDGIFNRAYDDDEDVGAVADFNNMDNTIAVSPIPTLRILGDPTSAVQTRGKIQKASSAQQALVSYIHRQNRTNHKDHQNCLFACFLSQEEPKTISQALQDESWVKAMQEELLQFKLQKVWVLVDFPYGKKVIGTKWVFRNKRDERSIVVKNKARFVAQRFRQEEGKRLMMRFFATQFQKRGN